MNKSTSTSWPVSSWISFTDWLSPSPASPSPPLFSGSPQPLGAPHQGATNRKGCSRPDGGCDETGVHVEPTTPVEATDFQEQQFSTGAQAPLLSAENIDIKIEHVGPRNLPVHRVGSSSTSDNNSQNDQGDTDPEPIVQPVAEAVVDLEVPLNKPEDSTVEQVVNPALEQNPSDTVKPLETAETDLPDETQARPDCLNPACTHT